MFFKNFVPFLSLLLLINLFSCLSEDVTPEKVSSYKTSRLTKSKYKSLGFYIEPKTINNVIASKFITVCEKSAEESGFKVITFEKVKKLLKTNRSSYSEMFNPLVNDKLLDELGFELVVSVSAGREIVRLKDENIDVYQTFVTFKFIDLKTGQLVGILNVLNPPGSQEFMSDRTLYLVPLDLSLGTLAGIYGGAGIGVASDSLGIGILSGLAVGSISIVGLYYSSIKITSDTKDRNLKVLKPNDIKKVFDDFISKI